MKTNSQQETIHRAGIEYNISFYSFIKRRFDKTYTFTRLTGILADVELNLTPNYQT